MRLVTLATYPTPEEAQLARNLLEAEDIPSRLGDTATVGMQWTLGNAVGWVKLLVREEDVQRAQRVIDQREPLTDDVPDDEDDETIDDEFADVDASNDADPRPTLAIVDGWLCPACNVEVDDDDAECWSCGTQRHGWQNPYVANQTQQPANLAAAINQSLATDPRGDLQSSAETIARAWRAAIIGIFCFPPLGNLYSLFLLFTVPESIGQLSPVNRRIYRTSMTVNLVVLLVMTFGLWAWSRWLLAGGQFD